MKLFNKKDGILIIGILFVALVCFLFFRNQGKDGEREALIYHGRELVMQVNLEEGVHKIFSVPGYPQVVFEQFEDGTICFRQSDCPDKVCVNTGRLGRSGESAACLPNELILNVRSMAVKGEEIDAVTR